MKTNSVRLWHVGITLALLLVFSIIVPVGAQTVSLLQNGGFETGALSP